jgi:hypothetical protein
LKKTVLNEIEKEKRDDYMPNKKEKYLRFLQKLPFNLRNIEINHDVEETKPLQTAFMKILSEYDQQYRSSPYLSQEEWLDRQRTNFLESKKDYENGLARGEFLSNKLHSLGLGLNESQQIAQQVDRISQVHKERVTRHKRNRQEMLTQGNDLPPLSIV